MSIEIVGNVDVNRLYCAGSFTKCLTTFVCLSKFAETYKLEDILDDDDFLDNVSTSPSAQEFLAILHHKIGSKFTLRDVCSFYDGLPYTFDLSEAELEDADLGKPFKHHSIMDEDVFLSMCRNQITKVDPNRCKFHYSELSIILLGYLTEQIYGIKVESLYQKYIIDAFSLTKSLFSRTRPANAYYQDLSVKFDYPCVGIMDHGFLCYGNSFYTTLTDQKKLLEQIIETPVFKEMVSVTKARSALNQIMNGLTIELRVVGDDVVFGYDGMSFSGCNAWVYSSKHKKGYVTIADNSEDAYSLVYKHLGYTEFDEVPEHSTQIYRHFLATKHYHYARKAIPETYLGNYQRVKINDSELDDVFTVDKHHIDIRNPDPVRYDVLYDHGIYRISIADHMHGAKVGFYRAKSGNRYMFFDGTLYKKI